MRWTTPEDIATRVRRRWTDGSLLRAFAAGEPLDMIEVPVRGPTASQIGDDLLTVKSWIARLDAGRRSDRHYSLEWASVGGRHFGRNLLPSRARVSTFEQAWALLGVGAEVGHFEKILALASANQRVRAWVLAHPHKALAIRAEWPALLAAYTWLDTHRGSSKYLREITAPDVDTKFAERHRATLAALLDVPVAPARFLAALGLRAKPSLVRMRVAPELGLLPSMTEVAVRTDDLAGLALTPRTAVVCENEITYLSVPVPEHGVAIWGRGFEVGSIGQVPWLVDADIVYWGDIDSHGFAILNRLRAHLPQTRSVLMDRETLLAHRQRWGREERPTRARLDNLSPAETELYEELVTDQLGDQVRLEQERIDWAWATARLPEE